MVVCAVKCLFLLYLSVLVGLCARVCALGVTCLGVGIWYNTMRSRLSKLSYWSILQDFLWVYPYELLDFPLELSLQTILLSFLQSFQWIGRVVRW